MASFSRGHAQNLVYNGSFEIYDSCPTSLGQIYYSNNWFQPYAVNGNVTEFSSSDYFNSCSSIVNSFQNSQGHQIPLNGNAYAGVICFGPGLDSYREYIETKLISTLKNNYIYCVEFYVSLADTSSYSMNRVGVYFSADSMLLNHTIPASTPPFLLSYKPQVENDSAIILNDKANWVKISGSIVAQGGERYITLGNFYDNASTTMQTETGNASYAYYYVDDVSVILCDSITDSSSTLFIPNAFTPNGDGKNDVFKAEGQNITELHTLIFNRWGELIYEWDGINGLWDGRYKGYSVLDGIYVYKITATGSDGIEYSKYGTLAVMR